MIKLYTTVRIPPWSLNEINFRYFIFNGGEPHVILNDIKFIKYRDILIDCRFQSMNDLGCLLTLTNALKNANAGQISLFIPYFPGARQDRITSPGTAFTAKVFADIINSQNYQKVFVLDPHSDVTPALINNVEILNAPHPGFLGNNLAGLICPDAGAEKRTHRMTKLLGITNIAYARKVRNPATGELCEFSIDSDIFPGNWMIYDDICDGGGTFTGLIETIPIKERRDYKFILYVSHGLFSKGTAGLFQYFDYIVTTDSFPQQVNDNVKVINLLDTFKQDIMERL